MKHYRDGILREVENISRFIIGSQCNICKFYLVDGSKERKLQVNIKQVYNLKECRERLNEDGFYAILNIYMIITSLLRYFSNNI